jgi:protein SCO1/2
MTLRATLSVLSLLLLAACGRQAAWHATDITGAMPPLDFHMIRSSDNAPADASQYEGKVTLLYFGYTHCPDICPTTLANLADMLQRLGKDADDVRVLFVTVDPGRDSLPILKAYTQAFAPQIDGLRGTDDALVALARRYRVAYGVNKGPPYTVMHSDAVFFFDKAGHARLVATSTTDTAGLAEDVKRLLD